MSEFTKAGLYSSAGKQTPVFVRFSTVTFGREFPDEGRNPRGFAIKHYTEDGNYDVVGLNFVGYFTLASNPRALIHCVYSLSSFVATLFKVPMSFVLSRATLRMLSSIMTPSSIFLRTCPSPTMLV